MQMLILAAGLGVLVFLLLIAYAAMPARRKTQLAEAVMPAPEPLRYRSHRDLEIDEDAELIASHYRQTARDAYTKAALARHRESLVDADTRESTFRAAIAAWATSNTTPAKSKS